MVLEKTTFYLYFQLLKQLCKEEDKAPQMLGVIVEHFLSQFELSVALLHDDLPERGALYDHGEVEAQVVAQSRPGVPQDKYKLKKNIF